MNRLILKTCLGVAALAASVPAQDKRPPRLDPADPFEAYIGRMATELVGGKVTAFREGMALRGPAAERFWSLYPDIETRLLALGKRQQDLANSIRGAAAGGPDEELAARLAKQWFEIRAQRLDVLRTAYRMLRAEISAVRAGQFVQLEHRLGSVMDAITASTTPLVPPPVAKAKAVAEATDAGQQSSLAAYLRAMRADLARGKVTTVSRTMRLTSREEGQFWMIYQEYESDLFELGDRRHALVTELRSALRAGPQDRTVDRVVERWFALEEERSKIVRHYHGVFTQEMSAIRAGQFVQLEHRFQTLTDLILASKLPLIRPSD